MDVKIGVQHVARELSVETEDSAEAVLEALNVALTGNQVFSLSDAKGRTVAVPAENVAYLYFVSDAGRKVGFGLVGGS
jgi:hypothetical protein